MSKLEKAIYNPYLCYIPIIIVALSISIRLFQLTPTRCLFESLTNNCLSYDLNLGLIYHPLNIINFIFVVYNILYIYYNVILKQDVVGRSVRKIYTKTKKNYFIKRKRQQVTILLFCYGAALLLSYLRFPITLTKLLNIV